MHAQNFRTGSTYDNVHQRMPTYGNVPVTYEKRIPAYATYTNVLPKGLGALLTVFGLSLVFFQNL